MRKRAKIDSNQTAIVEALRKRGWLVLSLAPMGGGVPDLLIAKPYRYGHPDFQPVLIEVKTPKGKLTPDQDAFIEQGWPVTVIRSVDEALAL